MSVFATANQDDSTACRSAQGGESGATCARTWHAEVPRPALAQTEAPAARVRAATGGHAEAITVITLALTLIGLIMIASTSLRPVHSPFEAAFWATRFGKQIAFVAAGLTGMLVTARFIWPLVLREELLRRLVPLLALAGVVLCLMIMLVPAFESGRHGTHRWLTIGPAAFGLRFQPSEFAKLALVMILAFLLGERPCDPRSLIKAFLPAAAVIGLFVGLVGIEDFGTAALLGAVGAAILFAGGCRLIHLGAVGLLAIFGFAGLLLVAPYRIQRLTAFLDPTADPLGAGYHPMQSLMTIASGGWLGTGLGGGIQKHGYLPESSTDFIFAVICEEAGVIGGLVVIGLFAALVWMGLKTMWRARTRFERLLALGITAVIGLQAAMNVAVATVSAPTKGISLPLVSAGGSGVVLFCSAIGLLMAIDRRSTSAKGEGLSEACTACLPAGRAAMCESPTERASD